MSIRRVPVGSMLKGNPLKLAGKVVKTEEPGKDSAHLDFIRRLPCLVTGKRPVDAAHVSFAAAVAGKPSKGIGRKADDMWTVPLTNATHLWEQHEKGEIRFWKEHGFDRRDVLIVCLRLKILSLCGADVRAGEKVIADARSVMKGPMR